MITKDEVAKAVNKGQSLEELLRAYFLRAGFFVIRGLLFQLEGEDLTDIDLWLYERSTATVHRRQIVDIKSGARPKAKERIIWTKGISEVLQIDKAYVATTDHSSSIRKLSAAFGIEILDGADLQRIRDSEKVLFSDRITEENLNSILKSVDSSRKDKEFSEVLRDLKSSVLTVFGPKTAVRALEALNLFARKSIEAHPDSEAARTAGRLVYFSAAIVAISLDYVGAQLSFRPKDERRELLVNAIRYGSASKAEGLEGLTLAMDIIRQFLPNGDAASATLQQSMTKELSKIPAEIVADHIISMDKSIGLFSVARELEEMTYRENVPNFDGLNLPARSFIGALLDFSGIDRAPFAKAWDWKPVSLPKSVVEPSIEVELSGNDQQTLFPTAKRK